jgi:HEAT repeat protein
VRILLFLLFAAFCFADEQEWIIRLEALRVLKDSTLSVQAADSALLEYPHQKKVLERAIMLYADAGDRERLFQTYRKYLELNPEINRDLVEEMAWGVIETGSQSQAPITRIIAMIAGAMSNDARGIRILAKGHQDSHRLVRLLAGEFSCHFRDATLQEIVLQRLMIEKDYAIRMALIKGCGNMGLKEAEPLLLQIVSNERTRAEEKVAAIASLVNMKQSADRREVEAFVKSPRAGLRMLGSELLRLNDRREDDDLVLLLLDDVHPDVKATAIETAGLLGLKSPDLNRLESMATERNAEIALRAAWWMTLQNPLRGQKLFLPYLQSEKSQERQLAAAFLSRTGRYGFPLTWNAFQTTTDPYVKLNLAQVLIDERKEPAYAARFIREFLQYQKERIAKRSSGIAEWIAPAVDDDSSDIPNLKDASNQIVRLELINSLVIEEDPQALEAVKVLLKERSWGVTGVASSLLLTEGDPEAADLIKELLKDPSDKVKLQAALVLGIWGRSPDALSTLEQLYPRASREQKEHILEALGSIGDSRSLPFLVERMNEHQQVLRMIAASSVLRTLYH